jgi:hypothetical protein
MDLTPSSAQQHANDREHQRQAEDAARYQSGKARGVFAVGLAGLQAKLWEDAGMLGMN